MRNAEQYKYIDKFSIKEPRAWLAWSGVVLLGLVIYGFAILYKGPILNNKQYGIQLSFGKFWHFPPISYQDSNILAYATLDDKASIYVVAEPLQQDALRFSGTSDQDILMWADKLKEQYLHPSVPSEASLPSGSIATELVRINGKRFIRLQYTGPNDTLQMIWEGNYSNIRYRIFALCPAQNKKLRSRIEQAVNTVTIQDLPER